MSVVEYVANELGVRREIASGLVAAIDNKAAAGWSVAAIADWMGQHTSDATATSAAFLRAVCEYPVAEELGLLHEWRWPGGDWEIVTGGEVGRLMKQVGAGTVPGPVDHACPPGVLSGLSPARARVLARAAGLLDG